jgi:hypothetical protein
MSWIQTYSGKKLFPLNPDEKDICIEDIAHALAMQCRFTGHTKYHYSIAQHSVLVSLHCGPVDARFGLMHDGSEAYLCDIASPIKHDPAFSKYCEIEKHLQSIIYTKFGLIGNEPLGVKKADLRMLATEARDLIIPIKEKWNLVEPPFDFKIQKMYPEEAEKLFLNRFDELFG